MYHPSEWERYFDEKKTGRYRYKHKGSGVIRDTFMTIGELLKNNKTAEKERQKRKPLSQEAKKKLENILQKKQPIKLDSVEKGLEKIWKIQQEQKKRKPLSQDAQTKLNQILAKKINKKIFFLLI